MSLPEGMIITSFFARKSNFTKSKSIHINAGHVNFLSYRIAGKKSIRPDGAAEFLSSPEKSIVYIPKNTAYDEEAVEDGCIYTLHFDLPQDCFGEPFVFIPPSSAEYENMFRELCEDSRLDKLQDYHCLSMIYAIFAKLRQDMKSGEGAIHSKYVKLAVDRINRSYDSTELSVAGIAGEVGISEVSLRHEFNRHLGMSPIDYIKKIRIENAKAMLETGLYTVGEVATACGFDSISYFSSEFKRRCGIPPSKYSKK